MTTHDIPLDYVVIPEDAAPERADKALAAVLGGKISRSAIVGLCRAGRVLMDGRHIKASTIVAPGDRIQLCAEAAERPVPVHPVAPGPSIIFEDEHLIVVDKPHGLTVHPAPGTVGPTLCEILVASRPDMAEVGDPERPGIVHRLDRDTSGVMTVAKTPAAHAVLSAMFKAHDIHRMYLALVRGEPVEDRGLIDVPIGRHTKDRKRMSTHTRKPRRAVTRWEVLERFPMFTLLSVFPETGRTHQIRVHLAQAGLPIVGDPVYGRVRKGGGGHALQKAARNIGRQALHAAMLGFDHPIEGSALKFESQPPEDMTRVIAALRGTR